MQKIQEMKNQIEEDQMRKDQMKEDQMSASQESSEIDFLKEFSLDSLLAIDNLKKIKIKDRSSRSQNKDKSITRNSFDFEYIEVEFSQDVDEEDSRDLRFRDARDSRFRGARDSRSRRANARKAENLINSEELERSRESSRERSREKQERGRSRERRARERRRGQERGSISMKKTTEIEEVSSELTSILRF
jgi:hypothetical protein